MRSIKLIYLPLVLAGVAVPVAAATTFANALAPNLFAVAEPPPSRSADDPATANTPTAPAMPADPDYHGQPYVGALTAPSAEALNKSYPACSASVQDNCRNADGH